MGQKADGHARKDIIKAADGSIYCESNRSIYHYNPEKNSWTKYPLSFSNFQSKKILVDAQQRVWAFNERQVIVYALKTGGIIAEATLAEGSSNNFFIDHSGAVWVSSGYGYMLKIELK